MIHDKRGQQEAGPLQRLMVGLLLVSVVAVLSLSFVADLGETYNVDVQDNSSLSGLNNITGVRDRTENFVDTIKDIGNPIELVTSIIGGGYNLLLLFFDAIPSDFQAVVSVARDTLNLPDVIGSWIVVGITLLVLFAVLALIMKVRG